MTSTPPSPRPSAARLALTTRSPSQMTLPMNTHSGAMYCRKMTSPASARVMAATKRPFMAAKEASRGSHLLTIWEGPVSWRGPTFPPASSRPRSSVRASLGSRSRPFRFHCQAIRGSRARAAKKHLQQAMSRPRSPTGSMSERVGLLTKKPLVDQKMAAARMARRPLRFPPPAPCRRAAAVRPGGSADPLPRPLAAPVVARSDWPTAGRGPAEARPRPGRNPLSGSAGG